MLKYKKLLKLGFSKPINKKIRDKKAMNPLSHFGQCNLNLQKLKAHYHRIRTGYLAKCYKKLKNSRETHIQDKIVSLLESRLDSVIFRSGLTKSHAAASQIVSHGHTKVNGRKVDIRSYILKVNDIVELTPKFILNKNNENLAKPQYLKVDFKEMIIKFLRVPTRNEIPFETAIDFNKAMGAL